MHVDCDAELIERHNPPRYRPTTEFNTNSIPHPERLAADRKPVCPKCGSLGFAGGASCFVGIGAAGDAGSFNGALSGFCGLISFMVVAICLSVSSVLFV